jgi:hypothetical protein
VFIALVGARAYPEAIMFQLLIKTRFPGGENPNLAFGLPHLLEPGDFELGAEQRDPTGEWRTATANFDGGGGGGEPDAGEGNFEFRWWVPVPTGSQGLRLWCRWEARGVGKSAAELDVDAIVSASQRCLPVWSTDETSLQASKQA